METVTSGKHEGGKGSGSGNEDGGGFPCGHLGEFEVEGIPSVKRVVGSVQRNGGLGRGGGYGGCGGIGFGYGGAVGQGFMSDGGTGGRYGGEQGIGHGGGYGGASGSGRGYGQGEKEKRAR